MWWGLSGLNYWRNPQKERILINYELRTFLINETRTEDSFNKINYEHLENRWGEFLFHAYFKWWCCWIYEMAILISFSLTEWDFSKSGIGSVTSSFFLQHDGSWNGFERLSPRRRQMNITALSWWIWHHGCAYDKFQISQLEGCFQEIKIILSENVFGFLMQVAKRLALFAQRTQQSTCLSEQRTEGIKDMMCSGSYSAFHFAGFFFVLFFTSGEQNPL